MNAKPWRIRHVDLAEGPQAVDGDGAGALLVFWWRSLPLGAKPLLAQELPFSAAQVKDLSAHMIADQLAARRPSLSQLPRAGVDGVPRPGNRLREAARAEGLLEQLDALSAPSEGAAERLSVVICTRQRAEPLARCLDSLAAQAGPPGQVVVVDNSRAGDARTLTASHPGVTYVHEPRPGLSVARNAGLAAARGEIVAFTDDDVELSPTWTLEILRAFEDVAVDAVTGLVLPASLETPAQRAFELDLGGFTSRFTPLLFDESFLAETRHMGPQVWRIGAGANMAFRRASIASLGGFDERLGAGAAGCSEDSEFWYRILAAGGTCLYEPRAVAYHHHRETWAALRQQFRAYMRGHLAALVAQADRYGDPGNVRRIFRQLPSYFIRTGLRAIQNLQGWRLALLAVEVTGWLAGLTYLARPAWRRKRVAHARPAAQAQQVRHA